jgi:hypothetical protein
MVKQIAALVAIVAVVTVGTSPVVNAHGGHNNNVGKKIHLTLEKDWVVADDPDDLFDKDDVEVDFDVKVYRDNQFVYDVSIDEGDSFEVKKNDFIVIEEDVTNFPDECDYTAQGLKTGIWVSDDHHTHTVVNTVTCDEEDEDDEEPAETEEEKTSTPKVSSAVTTKSDKKQVVAPVGGVDAGAGGAGSAGVAAGLFTSVMAAGAGVVARKRALLK